VFIVKLPDIVVVVYVATNLVNKDDYIIYYAYTSAGVICLRQTWSLLSFCLYVYASVVVFLCCYRFSVNEGLYIYLVCQR